MKFTFSDEEIAQLIKGWAAISLAFSLASFVNGAGSLSFLFIFFTSAVTVGIAFIVHELAHKFVAQHYGCWAEFRSFDMGLLLAVIMSLSGFIFAAPGAVVFSGVVSTSERGKIAAAGPITNIVLALLGLLLLSFFSFQGELLYVLQRLVGINAWLTVFNLIPLWNLDGLKVFAWNRIYWLMLMLSGLFLMLA